MGNIVAWSAPSSISPNNLASGLLLGVDIYDAVRKSAASIGYRSSGTDSSGITSTVVIRSQKALETFYTHKATLGTDFAVVAGPFGVGATAEAGELAPLHC